MFAKEGRNILCATSHFVHFFHTRYGIIFIHASTYVYIRYDIILLLYHLLFFSCWLLHQSMYSPARPTTACCTLRVRTAVVALQLIAQHDVVCSVMWRVRILHSCVAVLLCMLADCCCCCHLFSVLPLCIVLHIWHEQVYR